MDEATHRYSIKPNQLTIHQDRGSPMIAHRYIDLMGELGVTLSHSRPRVSNDNAMSEAKFKTLKYQPDYPGKFDHSAHATQWCSEYFEWYNFSHHHSGLAGLLLSNTTSSPPFFITLLISARCLVALEFLYTRFRMPKVIPMESKWPSSKGISPASPSIK